MTRVKRIDHVAIVVEDIEKALGFWQDALGLSLDYVEEVPDQEAVVAFLPTGTSELELVRPTTKDSGIARFMERRGPGIHHICFEVDDIEGALAKMKARGLHLVNEEPMIGTGGKRIAFVHPESTHGVLVELYELSGKEPEIRFERAKQLADRALASGQVMAAAVLGFLQRLRTDGSQEPATETQEESTPAPTR